MQSIRRCFSIDRRQVRHLSNFGLFDIHPEVQAALSERRAVVACETAILTHGLPRPINVETCLQIEQIIRQNGSTPATIAIVNGRIKVGLDTEELQRLGTSSNVFKASRRDLPYLISRRASAGTTVAATMLIAHRSGIQIFATGGIGGVHRDSTMTGDISSDLDELGRTPVCVVSSGVKSILDIPKTLEYLETRGVGVYTFGDSDEFPNFFTRTNQFRSRSCASIPSIDEAARLVQTMIDLKLDSGLLLAVPIDKEDELQIANIESIIQTSLEQATKQGITGNRVTPFVLAEIRRQTGDQSIRTNQNLVYKNARVASQIAAALSSEQNKPSLIVVGARNLDIHVQLNTEFKVNQGSTLPSRIRHNFGGVAYNITHALHLLGHSSVRLLTVSGRSTTFQNNESNLSVIEEIPNESSASYVSILDAKTNELICGLGDMGIYERQINREFFEKYRSFLKKSQWIMFDANLSCSAMKDLTIMGNELNKYLVFISAGGPEKARRIRPYLSSLDVLLCNRLEFQSISDSSSIETALDRMMKLNPRLKLISITMGADGVLIGNNQTMKHYRALKINENEKNQIENVTGAGDSFAAGLMNYLLKFDLQNLDRAVACGLLAAKFTLTSPNTISDRLKTIDEKLIDDVCSKELCYELIRCEQTPIRNESSFFAID